MSCLGAPPVCCLPAPQVLLRAASEVAHAVRQGGLARASKHTADFRAALRARLQDHLRAIQRVMAATAPPSHAAVRYPAER